jgi:hypothetical protein
MFRGRIYKYVEPYLPSIEPQQANFIGHSLALQGAVIYALPLEFIGLGVFKRIGYITCIWSTIGTALYTLKSNVGAPPMPENLSFSALRSGLDKVMEPMKPWMQKALESVDFHFLFFALIFLNANPSIFPIAILGRRSLWSVATQCDKPESPFNQRWMWLKFKPTWDKLKARGEEVVVYSALAEVMLAFWLTANLLLPSRQLFATFLYWYYLVMRYQVPRSHKHHAQAWQRLDASAAPLFKAVPVLRKPVEIAKGYFNPQR